jgi:hypothetical protein
LYVPPTHEVVDRHTPSQSPTPLTTTLLPRNVYVDVSVSVGPFSCEEGYSLNHNVCAYAREPQLRRLVMAIWNAASFTDPRSVFRHPLTSEHVWFTRLNVPPVHVYPLSISREHVRAHCASELAFMATKLPFPRKVKPYDTL